MFLLVLLRCQGTNWHPDEILTADNSGLEIDKVSKYKL
jgi:hypothetical protein